MLVRLSDRIIEGIHERPAEQVAGDCLLNDILQVMLEFHDGEKAFELRGDQQMMVAHIVTACLPLIYRNRLEENRSRILKMLGTDSINELLLIIASRRVGKTTCIAIFVAALIICKPTLKCSIFAMVVKAARRVMDMIKQMLDMHPRGRVLDRERNNTLELTLVDPLNPIFKKQLDVYPATTNVRFF